MREKIFQRRQGSGGGNPSVVERVEKETGTQRSQMMGKGAMGFVMLRRRQVTPRCENDPVWMH